MHLLKTLPYFYPKISLTCAVFALKKTSDLQEATMVSPAGQANIAAYKIGGEQLFFPNARAP